MSEHQLCTQLSIEYINDTTVCDHALYNIDLTFTELHVLLVSAALGLITSIGCAEHL
jgi:hypothetical protein